MNTAVCEVCKISFSYEPHKNGTLQKYCTKKCYWRDKYIRRKLIAK